jgi:hypothetical protein
VKGSLHTCGTCSSFFSCSSRVRDSARFSIPFKFAVPQANPARKCGKNKKVYFAR